MRRWEGDRGSGGRMKGGSGGRAAEALEGRDDGGSERGGSVATAEEVRVTRSVVMEMDAMRVVSNIREGLKEGPPLLEMVMALKGQGAAVQAGEELTKG
ncbi:hypothetical protein CYMTET_41898 [Cymbomonas tetramitiformis]|uniref:Uncharacterized protein n=1 Tax=Cymbomonas tetramitiformis TaxID=36881 RepID=A0AAE0C6H6_9CHLO|nr:hypothetical protein CYMTET_41898 [Cymbomonas tetramitiformis]